MSLRPDTMTPAPNPAPTLSVLCETVCGVNLSVGYYHEHGPEESFVYGEWAHTLEIVRAMLKKELRRFPMKK